MLGALLSGRVLKMVVLADQDVMSGQAKAQRAASQGWRSGFDGVRLDNKPLLTKFQQG